MTVIRRPSDRDRGAGPSRRGVVLGGVVLGGAALMATGLAPSRGRADDAEIDRAIWSLLSPRRPDALPVGDAARLLREADDLRAVPGLILAHRYGNRRWSGAVMAELTGEDPINGWFEWMLWQEAHPEVRPTAGYLDMKRAVLLSIDRDFDVFLRPEHLAPEAARIRVEEIAWGGVRKDGIPSLDDPDRIPATDATWLRDDDLVFGVEIAGDARAYPLRIMGWHEMFNETIGGVPLALAYCTLCGAGILYETAVEGRAEPFVFGSSGFLYRSNKLMFDRQTHTLWNQFNGEPVVGPLAGSGIRLKRRPV
ncbi:MAG: DUF3179 domain-containing (seleno)protein, partial [Pseudomonadota bacterium]